MERIKRVSNTNYTTISNFVLRDSRLSLKAKGFLTTIFALPEDWDFSINGMVSIVKEGKSSIYSVISELREMGYCVITQSKDERGRFLDTTYSFYELPQTEVPVMDCPLTDFPETDNPHTENQPQLNKDINKKLNKSISASKEKISLSEIKAKKESEFRLKVSEFKAQYSAEMLKSFCDYWTESGEKSKQLRYEKQEVFDIARRLATWKSREKPVSFGTPKPEMEVNSKWGRPSNIK